jgi:hypothetical protein
MLGKCSAGISAETPPTLSSWRFVFILGDDGMYVYFRRLEHEQKYQSVMRDDRNCSGR